MDSNLISQTMLLRKLMRAKLVNNLLMETPTKELTTLLRTLKMQLNCLTTQQSRQLTTMVFLKAMSLEQPLKLMI